jgi:hypothetical protein
MPGYSYAALSEVTDSDQSAAEPLCMPHYASAAGHLCRSARRRRPSADFLTEVRIMNDQVEKIVIAHGRKSDCYPLLPM